MEIKYKTEFNYETKLN